MGLFVPAEYFEHGIIWEIENFSNLRLMSQSDQVSQFGSELSSMNRILNKKRSTSMRPSLYIIDNWGQGTLIGRTPTVWLGWIPGLYRIFYFENFAQILKSRKLRQYAWVFCSQSHYAGHFDMRNRIFWSRSQVCPRMPTYSNAHAKIQKWIFGDQVAGNWFEFGITVNDFWSSAIWAIQISGSKILKFPEFNLRMIFRLYDSDEKLFRWQTNNTCLGTDVSFQSDKYHNVFDDARCCFDWLYSRESQ